MIETNEGYNGTLGVQKLCCEAELLQSFVRVNINECENNSNIRDTGTTSEIAQDAKNATQKEKNNANTYSVSFLNKCVRKVPKKRVKRNGRHHFEEIYCDKDRAAAVNMGSKDIKQSLKLKQKEDRSAALQILEESAPETYLAIGNCEIKRGDLPIALDFITKALEFNPNEKNALIARSKCYILLGNTKKALADAEMALHMDKNFLKAIYQKAESLYFLSNFEQSLVYYHRGLHIRHEDSTFTHGVQRAKKAIENTIGPELSLNKTNNLKEFVSPIDPKQLKDRKKSAKPSKDFLLKQLNVDKRYLDTLIRNPNIKSKLKKDNTHIYECIQNTVDYVNNCKHFWRQQR